MNSKDYLTNKAFCPLAWSGLYINANGEVRACTRKKVNLGNLRDNSIHDIVNNSKAIEIRERMINGEKEPSCECCYQLEEGKKSFDIVSDRVFYLKELKNVDMSTYDDNQFKLKKIDIRWSNQCNFACVYCHPIFSTKWAVELDYPIKAIPTTDQRMLEVKDFVLERIEELEHVYFAGGEPLLMKHNTEIIQALWERNKNVHIRVNTNLSKTNTPNFDLLCKFPNVHWILSCETMEDEFEYIRHGGKWQDFLDNLEIIKGLNHKVSFNMLWTIFNAWSLFDTVEYFVNSGFQENSYIISGLIDPVWQDPRQLSDNTKQKLAQEVQRRIDNKPGYLLEDSYRNLLKFIKSEFTQDPNLVLSELADMDKRRSLNSQIIFPEMYKCLQD